MDEPIHSLSAVSTSRESHMTLHKPLRHLNHKQLLKDFPQKVALKISKRNATLLKTYAKFLKISVKNSFLVQPQIFVLQVYEAFHHKYFTKKLPGSLEQICRTIL